MLHKRGLCMMGRLDQVSGYDGYVVLLVISCVYAMVCVLCGGDLSSPVRWNQYVYIRVSII